MIETLLAAMARFSALDWQVAKILLIVVIEVIVLGLVWLIARLRPAAPEATTGLRGLIARINRIPGQVGQVVGRVFQRIPFLILLLLVLIIGALVQISFVIQFNQYTSPTTLWLIVALVLVAGILVYRERLDPVLVTAEKPAEPLPDGELESPEVTLRAQPWRTFLFALSVVAILYSAQQARDIENNLAAGLGWLLGVGLLIASSWPNDWTRRPDFSNWRSNLRQNWLTVLMVIIVLGASAFIRFYRLDLPNVGREQDAANFGVDVLNYLGGQPLLLFGVKWFFNTPSVYGMMQAVMFKIFGYNDVGLGVLSAIQGTLNIVFLFLLVRRMFGTGWGLLAAALLAVAQHHLYYSRTGENNLIVPLFMTMTLYFLHRGLYSKRSLDYVLSGISFGVGLWLDYNNKTVQMYPILAAILGYFFIVQTNYWKSNWARLGLFALSAILVLIPMWSGYYSQGVLFLDFSHGRFILSNLDRGFQRYGTDSVFTLIAHQIEFSFFGINYIGSGAPPNQVPMTDSITAVFFLIGLAYSVFRWRDTRYGMWLAWLVAGIQGSIWSIDPPYAHRLVMILVPVFALAAIGLGKMGQLIVKSLAWDKPLYQITIAAMLLGNIWYNNIQYYFNVQNYPPEWLHLKIVADIIDDNLSDHTVIFAGAPFVYTGHGEIEWYSQLNSLKAGDASNMDELKPQLEKSDKPVIMIFIGNTYPLLDQVRETYPNGVETVWHDDARNIPDVLKTYEITADQAHHPNLP